LLFEGVQLLNPGNWQLGMRTPWFVYNGTF